MYSDSGCTDANAISAAATVSDTTAPYIVDILTTTAFAGDAEKTVYAKHTNGAGSSSCATFTRAYKLDTTVPTLTVGTPSGSGDTRTITTTYADTNKSLDADFNVNALLNTLKISKNSGGDGELDIDLANGDYFGSSAALDGTTLAVGASYDDDGGTNSDRGAVYLFTKENGIWTQTLKISENGGGAGKVAIDLEDGDFFGSSVALDGNTLAVGASGDDDGGTDRGAVYLFTKESGIWTQTLKISDNSGGDGELDIDLDNSDNFGYSAALDGTTLAVGALGDDDGGSGAGAVYLFTKDGTIWTQTLKISDNSGGDGKVDIDLDADDRFGNSIALDGTTLAVGALYDDDGGTNVGAVYLFTKESNIWTQTLKISDNGGGVGKVAIDLDGSDYFGSSVALAGTTLAVGAPDDDDGGDEGDRGAVYLFTNDGSDWTQTLKISKNSGGNGKLPIDLGVLDSVYFGSSIALDGTTLAVGAQGIFYRTGAAFLFDASAMRYVAQTGSSCSTAPPQNSLPHVGPAATFTEADNDKYVCFWATDKAGNINKSISTSLGTIPALLTATFGATWIPNTLAISKTLAVSEVTTGAAAEYKLLGPTDPCTAAAYSASTFEKVSLPLSTGAGSITVSDDAHNTKYACVKLSKATTNTDRYLRSPTITDIDTTGPTVTDTTYYADAALNTPITSGLFKAGKKIYTKVSFSEDVENVLATGATARPEISYSIGTLPKTQYNIVAYTSTLSSGQCKAKSASDTSEYTCLYTVVASNAGTFKTTVGVNTKDGFNHPLAPEYVTDAPFHIDTIAPTIQRVVVNGTTLTVTMSEPIYAATTPAVSDFTITSTNTVTVTRVTGIPVTAAAAANTFTLTLSVAPTGTPTLSYVPSTTATKKIKDVAGNLLVGAMKSIISKGIIFSTIAGDDFINAAEDDAVVTIAGTSVGLTNGTPVTVKIDDSDGDSNVDLTKTANISSDAWSVDIPAAEVQALEEGDLTITVSVVDVPDVRKTIVYDRTSPTVAATNYYADAGLGSPITSGLFKAGKEIYTKVVFSEDLEDVLATGATARPKISYTVGASSETQYSIVVHDDTLTSGDCQAKDDSGTNEYHCLYTVAAGDTGGFKTTVGVDTEDTAGNALARAYEKAAAFTFDTTVPTVSSVTRSSTTLTVTMSETIYATTTPDPGDFTISSDNNVTVSGVTGIPASVATAANTFTLTLSAVPTGTNTFVYMPSSTVGKKIKDVAGNFLVRATQVIVNKSIILSAVAVDDIINATEDDTDVTISGTSTGLTNGTPVTVKIDDSDVGATPNITKTANISSDAWQVTISSTDMDALEEGDLTITVSATGAPDATKIITYDRALPIISSVTRNSTTLTVIMSEPIYAATTPDISDFTIVSSNSTNITHINAIPASASAVANTFTLTLSQVPTGTNTLSYAPSTTPAKKIKDVAGNLLVGATKDIVNNALTINSIAGDNFINAAEDDSDVTIAGTSTGLAQNTEVTVKIDDSDLGPGANITKTSRISGTDTWSVSISSTEMDALQKGDLTITASATGAPDAIKTITYDIASPTVTVTKYYADAALNSSIASTSFLKVGKKIYTKVVFSEDLEEVLATGATARPEISYTVGTSPETQYNIVVHTNTLTSGECQAKDDSGTREYHCLYTVATRQHRHLQNYRWYQDSRQSR